MGLVIDANGFIVNENACVEVNIKGLRRKINLLKTHFSEYEGYRQAFPWLKVFKYENKNKGTLAMAYNSMVHNFEFRQVLLYDLRSFIAAIMAGGDVRVRMDSVKASNFDVWIDSVIFSGESDKDRRTIVKAVKESGGSLYNPPFSCIVVGHMDVHKTIRSEKAGETKETYLFGTVASLYQDILEQIMHAETQIACGDAEEEKQRGAEYLKQYTRAMFGSSNMQGKLQSH